MSDFTPKQLEQAIVDAWVGTENHEEWVEHEGDAGDESFDSWFNFDEGWYGCDLDTPLGKVTVATYGRDKDNPNEQYVILTCAGRFFKVTGYYNSWDGGHYEDPELKEVIEAERVEKYWRYL